MVSIILYISLFVYANLCLSSVNSVIKDDVNPLTPSDKQVHNAIGGIGNGIKYEVFPARLPPLARRPAKVVNRGKAVIEMYGETSSHPNIRGTLTLHQIVS